uniref:Uncharacterized protein n=1 Tax=Dunaliella tertiolecta TaxID=3047 RepID=A0A7S3QZR8_DUNTE|eukprot:1157665-Pelagomonas_calceolata.AAC.14
MQGWQSPTLPAAMPWAPQLCLLEANNKQGLHSRFLSAHAEAKVPPDIQGAAPASTKEFVQCMHCLRPKHHPWLAHWPQTTEPQTTLPSFFASVACIPSTPPPAFFHKHRGKSNQPHIWGCTCQNSEPQGTSL